MKEKQRRAQDVTVTHATVTELTQKVQGRGHKLYTDNFFSSPQLFQDLARRQIYCCGTVRWKAALASGPDVFNTSTRKVL
jgi:hypothetical protein